MLLFPAYLAPSKIRDAGVGLYSRIDLLKGTRLWRFEPLLDRFYTQAEFTALPLDVQKHITVYGFPADGGFILDGDFGKFVNHSATPNTKSEMGVKGEWWTLTDIPAGTEITDNYENIYPG